MSALGRFHSTISDSLFVWTTNILCSIWQSFHCINILYLTFSCFQVLIGVGWCRVSIRNWRPILSATLFEAFWFNFHTTHTSHLNGSSDYIILLIYCRFIFIKRVVFIGFWNFVIRPTSMYHPVERATSRSQAMTSFRQIHREWMVSCWIFISRSP